MTTMTTAQRSAANAVSFRKKLGILHRASVAVVLCRSREPYRAIDAMRDFAHAETDFQFKHWTVLGGWHTPNKAKPEEQPDSDGNGDILGAMRAINDFANGMYVVMYPQPWIGKVPPLTQIIKDYARMLPETKRRVVLLCPPEFTLPVELQDDVVVLDFDLPSFSELREVYERTMGALTPLKRPKYTDENIDRIISNGAGMTAHEFETALSRALITHRERLPKLDIETISDEVLAVKVEAVKRTEVLEVVPVTNMDDVGGLGNFKNWVRKRRKVFGQAARDYGIDPLKGVLLAGPPGTGKSLLTKAVAHELGLPLIKFDVSRVFGSLVGQSESRVRESLRMVEAMAPCVVQFDEIDKGLGGSHEGGGDSGVSKRVLGVILTWLQENQAPVFAVFSANRVDQLPTELIRRGRLDEIFSVSIPTEKERRQVLEVHLRKRKQDPSKVDLTEAVEASSGYVPAELEAAVKDALIEAFDRETPITGAMIAEQLRMMTPLSVAFASQFATMKDWAEQNARPANGDEDDIVVKGGATPRARTRSLSPSGAGRAMDLEG